MPELDTRVIQVSNISPVTAKDQMKTLFNYIGKIDEIKLYPEGEAIEVATRICYIKFREHEDAGVALHLTNTVFIDRALIVVPVLDGKIPDEHTALGLNSMKGETQNYPALPASTELSKVEEIRRTIYVTNVDAAVLPEALMAYFTLAGEVKYVRMAGNETGATRSCFIEFTDQVSVVKALGYSGQVLGNYEIRVSPSNNAIVKTVLPGVTATSREIEEAMRKVNEAQSLISAAVDPERAHRSRSRRSKSRRHSHHRSYSRRSKSRRSRSHQHSKSNRSRSPKSNKKVSSDSRKKHRSQSRDKKKRSRSRGKKDKKEDESSKKKERSEGGKKEVRKRSRSHERSTKKSKRESSRVGRDREKKSTHSSHHVSSHRHGSRDRSGRTKNRERREKSKERSKKTEKSKKESKVERDYDAEEKEEQTAASDAEEQLQASEEGSDAQQENSANEDEIEDGSGQEENEDVAEDGD